MILFISKFGASLPIVYRMRREGAETEIYIHNDLYQNNYNGIFDKVRISDLKKMIDKADKIVFDSNVDLGSLQDCLENKTINQRRGLHNYESDPVEAKKLAKQAGIKVKKGAKGIQLVAEMWFNGKEPVLFTYSLPNQCLLTGDLGQKMASQSVCLWVKHGAELLKKELESLVPMLTDQGYVGAVSVDCTVNSRDKKPYFNNWRFGFRYDSIFCLLALLQVSVTEFLTEGFTKAGDGFACSERITIPPYPYTSKDLLSLAENVKLNMDIKDSNGFWLQDVKSENNEVRCAGSDGVLGVMVSTGRKIEDGFGDVYKSIRKLNIDAPLQFRIDGAKEANKKYKKLNDWNICVN